MASILVIEDDEHMAHRLFDVLFGRGHQVAVARRGCKPFVLQPTHADLVVFDMDGGYGSSSYQPWLWAGMVARPPTLFLTSSRGALRGLPCYNPAWDDYLTKPFEVMEVESRAEALLRRRQMWRETGSKALLCAGPVNLDVKRAEARVSGRVIPLTPTEFDLLRYLVSSAGEVISGEKLLRDVWGRRTTSADMGLIRTHIKNLRAKIGFSNVDPYRIIQTIPRHGYVVRKDAATGSHLQPAV